jgi:hypothetical protein
MKPHFFATIDEVRDIFSKYAEEHHGESDGDAQFDRWLAAHDAEVRADEREKAAQRLIKAQPWTNSNETYLTTEYAVFIARGEQA